MALNVLSKNIPESKYVKRTITIREMELPQEVTLTKQSLLRWLALSVGLLTESESRNTLVPVMDALLYFQVNGKDPSVAQIKDYLDEQDWGMRGKTEEKPITEKAIRYHLGKLREVGFVESLGRKYRLARDPENPTLEKTFAYVTKNNSMRSINQISAATKKLLETYK